jgi:predicted nucleic acid-binding Zn ribbon protein
MPRAKHRMQMKNDRWVINPVTKKLERTVIHRDCSVCGEPFQIRAGESHRCKHCYLQFKRDQRAKKGELAITKKTPIVREIKDKTGFWL